MDEEEKESEYYTVLELLESMSLAKALASIFGFFTIIGGITMFFVYWFTRHR